MAYAVDNGSPPLKTSVQIFVEITDVDDNPPAFPEDSLVVNVREDAKIGEKIKQFKAIDPDMSNSSITYDFGHDIEAKRIWNLDRRTGWLSPKIQLDYETRKTYQLTVSATSNDLVSQVRIL